VNLRDFFTDYLRGWEGGLSTDHDDPGNWTGAKVGVGQLVGSKYGVTPAALAKHRNVAVGGISQSAMANLTIDEAVDIAVASYYRAPGFDRLPWNRWTMSVIDMGWGSGPAQAIKLLQRIVGVADDGKIGPQTIGAVNAYLVAHGEEAAAWRWAFVRAQFYVSLKDSLWKYLRGWLNRTAYFTPASEWWARAA
jgi:lysozyme family protein